MSLPFENALQRERERQRRQTEGGKHTDVSARVDTPTLSPAGLCSPSVPPPLDTRLTDLVTELTGTVDRAQLDQEIEDFNISYPVNVDVALNLFSLFPVAGVGTAPATTTTISTRTRYIIEEVRENFVGIYEAFPMKTYLDMGDNFIYNVKTLINIDQATNKGYVDSAVTTDYQKKANIDMNNNRIINLPLPTGNNQPTTKAFTDNSYLHRDGSVAMNNNLNMNNKKIIHLLKPTDDTDAANKKYVDHNKVDFSNYLKVDGTNKMTGNLNMDSKIIENLNNPTNENDATNKK